MTKIKIPMFVLLGAAALFTLFSLSFSGDISLLAFPLCAGYTYLVCHFLLKKTYFFKDYKSARISRKLIQYFSFLLFAAFIIRRAGNYGTPYWYDVITVLLWCVVFVTSFIINRQFHDKRIFNLVDDWKQFEKKNGKIISAKEFSIKTILFEILDWIDALVQAVFMVLLIQIFIFQLYVIPTESMVPAFTIGDRVVVMKTPSGPKFPLSDVGLPVMRSYKKGDIVVFRNPHYNMDRSSEVKSVISQIVYMLTFTGVNLNVDENGDLKADPLVKRVCGEPGEQLVLQDGILKRRTAEKPEWEVVENDIKYAKWNLNDLPEKVKRSVERIPLTQEQYDAMIAFEKKRNDFELYKAQEECLSLVKEFNKIRKSSELNDSFIKFMNGKAGANIFNQWNFAYYVLSEKDTNTVKDVSELNSNVLKSMINDFEQFMTSWTQNLDDILDEDDYSVASFKLNLMMKIYLAKIYIRYSQLYSSSSDFYPYEDSKFVDVITSYNDCEDYLRLMDQRNMPVFPANVDGKPSYIPEDCYFMMGDNRFNSLDMRHSVNMLNKALTEYDAYTFYFPSEVAPQYVNKKYILGNAGFRFYPFSKMGAM